MSKGAPYSAAGQLRQEMSSPNPDSARIRELQDRLMSYPAKDPRAISCVCGMLELIKKAIPQGRNHVMGLLIDEVDRTVVVPKEFPDPDAYWQLLSRYLSGSSEITSEMLVLARDHRWGVLRGRLREIMDREAKRERDVVAGVQLTSEERLQPIIEELQVKCVDAVRMGEVTGEKALKLFTDMVRLQAQLKGELREKVDVEVSAGAAYRQLLLNPEQFKVIDVTPEPRRLIE